jgi:hypothetical protein
MEEGRTYNMTIDETSNQSEYDVTVSDVDESTVTLDRVTWTENGTEVYRRATFDRTTREAVNASGNYSRLWINASDVDTGVAKIGGTEFELVDAGAESYTFASGSDEYEFDAYSGVLLEAVDTQHGGHIVRTDENQGSSSGQGIEDDIAQAAFTISAEWDGGEGGENPVINMTCTVGPVDTVAGGHRECNVVYNVGQSNPGFNASNDVLWPVYANGTVRSHNNETDDASQDGSDELPAERYLYWHCLPEELVTQVPKLNGGLESDCHKQCEDKCNQGQREDEPLAGDHRWTLGARFNNCLQLALSPNCEVTVWQRLEVGKGNITCESSDERSTCTEVG